MLRNWKTKLEAIQRVSKNRPDELINNVMHILDLDLLKEVYRQLNGKKAVGIDGIDKEKYGQNLEDNLQKLLDKIHGLKYLAKPSRIVEIPKEDGSKRTLAIGCLEDKIIQGAVYIILQAIYEPIFLNCSYGFRPKRSCHDALKALNYCTYPIKQGAVIDMDIAKCFDTIPHNKMMEVLGRKISDKRLIRLIGRIMKSPTIDQNKTIKPKLIGCPQGNLLSPILANIFLHEILDVWFEGLKGKYLVKPANLIRYCDDVVIIFDDPKEAAKVYKALPKRLSKYGLQMHMGKSQLIPTGRIAALKANKKKEPFSTYKFLGFTCYFGKSIKGSYRLKFTSRKDRFTTKLKEIRELFKENLNVRNSNSFLKQIATIMRGWINYHGVSDNSRRVNSFIEKCRNLAYWWFNRRGKKQAMTWDKLHSILKRVNYPRTWKIISMFTTS